jgi:thioredoxin-dependent peroxiredoxin
MVSGMYRIEEGTGAGDFAPDFRLRDSQGEDVRLSNYKGRVNVLLVFYRGEADPYSMRWLSRLSDDYLFFRGLEADILAISPDDVETVRDTATRYKLPFKLLADPGKAVIREYGVYDDLENGDDASIFLIDRSGRIRYRFVSKFPGELPPNDKLMETLRNLT